MLAGERVTLRYLKAEDKDLYQKWINDRDIIHYNTTYYPVSDYSHDRWFEEVSTRKDLIIFSIVENANRGLIGSCSLRNINQLHRNGEVQIRIGEKEFHGKGYGSEAVKLLVEYGFVELNLHRIFLQVFNDNLRAIKSYKKCGFVEEGTLRDSVYINGTFKDLVIMSILRDEFEASV